MSVKAQPNPNEPDGPLWEIWPDESPETYTWFLKYRDQPVRSLRSVAREMGCSYQNVLAKSKRWQWERRAKEYDTAVSREHAEKQKRDILKMRARYAKSAKRLHLIADRGIRAWIESLETVDPSTLDLVTLTKILDMAEKLEARSRGKVEDRGTLDPEGNDENDDSAHDDLARLLDGIRQRAGENPVVAVTEPEASP